MNDELLRLVSLLPVRSYESARRALVELCRDYGVPEHLWNPEEKDAVESQVRSVVGDMEQMGS